MEEDKTTPIIEAAPEPEYSKERLLNSKKYAERRDLLRVLLKDNRRYTIKEVDSLIKKFMKGKVK